MIDEYRIRELVAQQFASTVGGDSHSVRQRIPYVNMIARKLADGFDVTGWPDDEAELIDNHIKRVVEKYV